MKFISTRGRAAPVGFDDALLAALAPDGGLYLPQSWPQFAEQELARFADCTFAEAAAAIIGAFAHEDHAPDALLNMAERAYATFDHPQTTPLARTGEEDWILELHHGPTLAFKDIAMQFLGNLFETVLERRDRRATIIGATSGDTGAAAIEAFRGLDRVDVFILHPEGKVSEVQRRIMTSVAAGNVHNIAIDGTFDDCQRIVKALFKDQALSQSLSLSGVNSINWARLAVQITYYFTSAVALAKSGDRISYSTPTGNFGDVFAGYAAKRMGAPIERLCIAVNDNDILHRALTTGEHAPRTAIATSSPSMDIQIASNFERLVFEAGDRDAVGAAAFAEAAAAGEIAHIHSDTLAAIRRDFVSERVSIEETTQTIKMHYDTHGALIDPHTAVGVCATKKAREAGALSGPVVTLATAHPAKFPEVVSNACGVEPALPAHLSDLYEREEYFSRCPADAEAVSALLKDRARAGRAS